MYDIITGNVKEPRGMIYGDIPALCGYGGNYG